MATTPTLHVRHVGWFVAACVLVVLAGTSCSSADGPGAKPPTSTTRPAAPAPGSSDASGPCALLTASQIEAATGWKVGPGERETGAPKAAGAVCNWERADREAAVQVQFHEGAGKKLFEERRSSLSGRGQLRNPVPVAVDGADDAFEVAAEGLLVFRVGEDDVQISVLGGDASADDHRQLAADVTDAMS